MDIMDKTGGAKSIMKRALYVALCFTMIFTCLPVGGGAFAADEDATDTKHTVSFDLNDGTGTAPAPVEVTSGAAISTAINTLPDGTGISRKGYTFKGWYAKVPGLGFGGMMPYEEHPIATVETVINADTTLYAAWQADVVFLEVPYDENSDLDGPSTKRVTLGITAASKLIDKNGEPIDMEDLGSDYKATEPIFKDLNGNEELDPYEDWRKPVADRVNDLADKLLADKTSKKGIEKMAGLMLYSSHQMVFDPYISDAQDDFLTKDYLRHILVMQVEKPIDAALWTNNVQAYLEGLPDSYGIPANNSSDPRHGADVASSAEYNVTTGGISAWPSSLGMAATFNPKTMLKFGQIASTEYRLMGIATALSPQIDIATDPRWSRFNGTFGEDPKLAADMAAAYVRGFQSSYTPDDGFVNEPTGGWGPYSVNAMIKHWPGGGSGEGGQDAHYEYGKYAVYPGGNFNAHLIPFVDGALGGKNKVGQTEKATAVMPYYTVSYLQVPGSEPNSSNLPGAKLNMANAYSDYMINDLLRGAYKFNGVVCTDWNVIGPSASPEGSMFGPTPGMIWGVDDHYPAIKGFSPTDRQGRADLLLRAGVNQFGGLNTIEPIVAAYNANEEEIEPFILASTKALLTNIFNPGLFENPYVDIEEATKLLGSEDFVEAGYQAQLDSMVLLKNKENLLPLKDGTKVYLPGAATKGEGGRETDRTVDADTLALVQKYFGQDNVITNPADAGAANVALVFGKSLLFGGGAYVGTSIAFKPAALDYKAYTATGARAVSVAGAPIRNSSGDVTGRTNNSYRGKTANPFDPIPGFIGTSPSPLPAFLEDMELAKASGKKIVFALTLTNPMVLEDIEPYVDAILVDFESQKSAVLDMIVGETKNGAPGSDPVPVRPQGMLPMQMPKDMQTVEAQYEDVPRDMTSYIDSEGKIWDFGFGLSYNDGRGYNDGLSYDGQALPIPVAYDDNVPIQTTPANTDGAAAIADRIKVNFDYDGDGTADFIKIVKNGSPVTDVVDPVPTRNGSRLTGWNNGTEAYDFRTPVTAELTLTPRWASTGAGWGGTGGGSTGTTATTPQAPQEDAAADSAVSEDAPGQTASGPLAQYSDQASVSSWARPFIERLVSEGVLGGRTDGTIDPSGDVTRAEFTKMVTLALKLTAAGDVSAFADVSAGDWYKEFVDIASSNNIINGISEASFAPNNKITRQDICTIVYRALATRGVTMPAASGEVFPDSASIADYARDAVSMLKQLGIVSGRDSGAFDPLAFATREETAKIVCGIQDFVAAQQPAAAAEAEGEAASEGAAAEGEAAEGGDAAADTAGDAAGATK